MLSPSLTLPALGTHGHQPTALDQLPVLDPAQERQVTPRVAVGPGPRRGGLRLEVVGQPLHLGVALAVAPEEGAVPAVAVPDDLRAEDLADPEHPADGGDVHVGACGEQDDAVARLLVGPQALQD